MGAGVVAAAAGAAGAALYRSVVSGALTVDFGIGRSNHSLGPLAVEISAPPDVVFDLVAAPYVARAPRGVAEHIDVLERSETMVLAAHRTPVRGGLVATTVETVRFERPHTITFRLVRGPVPHVVERFRLELHGDSGGTMLTYDGELGADFWVFGRWWGQLVARKWVATVDASLADIKERSERKAAAHRRRGR